MCDEMQRRLRYLRGCCGGDEFDMGIDGKVFDREDSGEDGKGLRLEVLDGKLGGLEGRLVEMDGNWRLLKGELNGLVELKWVLVLGDGFLTSGPRGRDAEYGSMRVPERGLGGGDVGLFGVGGEGRGLGVEEGLSKGVSSLLSFFCGVVEKDKVLVFERVLFRATRGNCHVMFADVGEGVKDPDSGEAVMKTVFMIFFSGSLVKTKVAKICNAFGAHRYNFPEGPEEYQKGLEDVEMQIDDLKKVIETTERHRQDILDDVAAQLPLWDEKVRREKAIFHTLNLLNFDMSNSLFIAEIWCPSSSTDEVRAALDAGRRRSRAQVPSIIEKQAVGYETAPTYYKINKFTSVFHGIVESYGVAQYEEVNPAPFTVITFPFLFAVMFGDVGHGIFMALFAAMIVLNEKRMVRRKLNEFMQTCYDGRYMLLLMGLFSIFTGLIYNECFAVPLNLFGSRWKFTSASELACGIDNCKVPGAVRAPLRPYPLGFDPVWKGSENGLVFFNSYKMKLSIILGVTQMVLGIYLSFKNAKFFREPLDVWHVFVPQMIFMNATFGYLVVIIILKWCINWDSPTCRADPNCIAPDLKSVLIGMFMSPGNVPVQGQLYPGQKYVQVFLLLLAFISVPWMLLPKPLLLKKRHEQTKREVYRPLSENGESQELLASKSDGDLDGGGKAGDVNGKIKSLDQVESEGSSSSDGGGGHGSHGKFDFTEIVVNQMIHTIEFVLGAVSNTASYLRLWALSLAHAELSDVFLEKLLFLTFSTGNPIFIIIGFFMWVGATLGVLMFMESLSAFLHALRLHWVEFQNKFYNLHGNGIKFTPFDYNALREEALES